LPFPTLKDKIVIITGGTGALGREVTKEFLEAGSRPSIPYIVDEEIDLLKQGLGSSFFSKLYLSRVDVSQWPQINAFVSEVANRESRIDILVNLVGGYFGGPMIHETEERDWDRMMNLNLKSQFLSCKAVLPHMIQKKYGRIVNVASESALHGEATLGIYSISKSGIVRLTEAISEEVRLEGITANCVMPRIIDTPANRKAMPDADFSLWPKPSEVAKLILFLASDEASAITGASIPLIGRA
jgi:NAD(P)-dependent dehydrogenase (short-subunit alcohol dehydrogenase family)